MAREGKINSNNSRNFRSNGGRRSNGRSHGPRDKMAAEKGRQQNILQWLPELVAPCAVTQSRLSHKDFRSLEFWWANLLWAMGQPSLTNHNPIFNALFTTAIATEPIFGQAGQALVAQNNPQQHVRGLEQSTLHQCLICRLARLQLQVNSFMVIKILVGYWILASLVIWLVDWIFCQIFIFFIIVLLSCQKDLVLLHILREQWNSRLLLLFTEFFIFLTLNATLFPFHNWCILILVCSTFFRDMCVL